MLATGICFPPGNWKERILTVKEKWLYCEAGIGREKRRNLAPVQQGHLEGLLGFSREKLEF